MIDERLLERVRPWMATNLGIKAAQMRADRTPVVAAGSGSAALPLRAAKMGDETVVVARPEWTEPLQKIVDNLDTDLLFSSFGAYELARVTLRDGVGVWGPVWYLFGDERTVKSVDDNRVVQLAPADLQSVDYDTFWHCRPDSLAGFAVFEGDSPIALATVWDMGEPMWEIGMDVERSAKLKGLGRAVVGAAARWILDNGRIVTASTAPFNVPSARTLRSIGLQYAFVSMHGTEGLMSLAPQTLGAPFPGARLHNLYPAWAINKDILPKQNQSHGVDV